MFAVSEPLTLAEAPDESPVDGGQVDVDVDVSEMRPGRRLLVRGTTASGEERSRGGRGRGVEAVAGRLAARARGRPLGRIRARDRCVVHGNVALATHGETVQQLLGSGRARAPFQRFTLAHEPLTLPAVDRPVRRRLGARGAGQRRALGRGRRRSTAPGRATAPTRSRVDEQGKTYVQFGDGARGARLPSGSNNVRARYRKGLGAAGNVGPGALAQLLDRPLGVKGVSNPAAAARRRRPGARGRRARVDPARRCARSAAPSRCSTTRTSPARSPASPRPTRPCSRCAAAGRSSSRSPSRARRSRGRGPPRRSGHDAAHLRRPARRRSRCSRGTQTTFRLALKVAVDPAYETDAVLAAVEAALRAAYSLRRARLHRAGAPLGRGRGRAHGRRRARGRRRPALHRRRARPRRPPARPAAGGRRRRHRDRAPGCWCSTPRRSTGSR